MAAGDHHALPHAARELVRILLQPPLRLKDADFLQQLQGAGRGGLAAGACDASSGRRCSWRSIVNTGFSDVIGSWKIMPISLPRIDCIVAASASATSSTLPSPRGEVQRPAGDDAAAELDQPHQRQRGHRLAGAGFADHAHRLARLDREADIVDAGDDAAVGRELDAQAVDDDDGFEPSSHPR